MAAATQEVSAEMQEEAEPVLDVHSAFCSSFTTCVTVTTTCVPATTSRVAAATIFVAATNDCSLGVATVIITWEIS